MLKVPEPFHRTTAQKQQLCIYGMMDILDVMQQENGGGKLRPFENSEQ